MRTSLRTGLAGLTALGMTVGGLAAFTGTSTAAPPPSDVLVYGLVDGVGTAGDSLVTFRSTTPGTTSTVGVIRSGTTTPDLVGIDVRPATGDLYGLGRNGQLFLINTLTAVATPVGTPSGLTGANFDIDFNPQVDLLRVVSDTTRLNVRISPVTGARTATDTILTYATGDRRASTAPRVRGAAYTNNVATPTTTTLIDYDVAGNLDALVTQNPPNSGTLNTLNLLGLNVPETRTVGTTVVNTTNAVGLDIEAGTNNGFAVLDTSATAVPAPSFYSFDTTTGVFNLVGAFTGTSTRVEDIAVASPRISIAPAATGTEGGTAQVVVTRTGDTSTAVTVPYTSSATPTTGTGGATPDIDYTPATSTVTIPAGATSTAITFALAADANAAEGPEQFVVTLGAPTAPANAALTTARTSTVTILDGPPAGGGSTGGGTTGGGTTGGGTTGGGTTGGGTPASPSPSVSASASASPSASPSGSASPSVNPTVSPSAGVGVVCTNPVGIRLGRSTIFPGTAVPVTVTAPAGSTIQLQAYSRPSTTYSVARTAVVPSNGTVTFNVTPGTNTRLFANCVSQTRSASASTVINVRTALSLTVVRNARRNYTFQGRILPRRAGQLITLYRVTNSGSRVLTSQIKTDNTGTYRINRVFTGSGRFGFLTRTGQNLTNAAGESNTNPNNVQEGTGVQRPTLIF